MALSKITNESISGLSASKLTGSLPASMATDLAPVRSDILKLALHQAIDGNRVAYNLEDSFIDGFEDDTGITTETSVDRDTTGEYVNTSVLGSAAVYETGDRRSTITVTDHLPGQSLGFFNDDDGAPDHLVDGTNTANSTYGVSLHGEATSGQYCRFQFTTAKVVTECRWRQGSAMSHGVWKWQASNDATTFTDIGSSFTLGGSTAQLQTQLNGNTESYIYYQLLGISGTVSGAHYVSEVEFKVIPLAINATGTLISDPQTASTSRTSCSGVIIYENGLGTNTLGTDLKIYFTANNGTNWTEASSYGTATTYSGTKKLVKLGSTNVTAGTQVAMKAVWANQAASVASAYVTGDRQSTITVSDDGVVNDGDGVPAKLVDGVTNANSGSATTFYAIAVAGKYIRFQFSTSQVITEAKWYQSATNTHGVWKWQGSNDGTSFTDIGNDFTLGGTLQTQTELNGNTTSYTYYQLLGVSGNSSGSPWVREIEFKPAAVAGKEARLHGWAVNY